MFHPLANSRQLGHTSKRNNDEVAFSHLEYLQLS